MPVDSNAFWIITWLRGDDVFDEDSGGALHLFFAQDIWNWIDQDTSTRAPFMARYVPKSLHRDEDRTCFSREMLIRYGNIEEVKAELIANFSSEGWTGPTSSHLRKKIRRLSEFRDSEDNDLVISWLNEYIDRLQDYLELALIEEERDN